MPKPKRSHWVVKTEPSEYSFQDLVKDRRTSWTGVRNFQARNNLRAMSPGDRVLVYHTGDERQIVGVARVASPPGPDPTAPGEDWTSVELEPVEALGQPVPLTTLKAQRALKDFALLKQGRLSVAPVTPEQFEAIVALGKARPRR